MGCSRSSTNGEVYSNTGLPQEIRKISNKQTKVTAKRHRKKKKRANETQSQ